MKYQFVVSYFKAEQLESFLATLIGLMALVGSIYFLFFSIHGDFYQGLSWPMFGIALLQIVVGGYVCLKSNGDIKRVESFCNEHPEKIKTEEFPRMRRLLKKFVIYRWIEIVWCIAGILMIILCNSMSSFWMGFGLGLFFYSLLLMTADAFAEQRGNRYVVELEKLLETL